MSARSDRLEHRKDVQRSAAPDRMDRFYAAVRLIGRFWLWFFLKSVDVRHPERVPASGPVLLCVNHPNNLIDSLLVGVAVRRKVHYLATAALFRNAIVARFLWACGVIPVYRRADDPDKMDRNAETFAACHAAFERGRLVAIYPEGTTHAESRVQRIRTGAARIALGFESQTPGRLAIVPAGLTFEARKSFRSRVLVSFGEPIAAGPYVEAFKQDPAKAVDALTTTIQWAMESQVVNVQRIDTTALVRAVEEIYRGELAREIQEQRGVPESRVDPFRLSRAIVDAVNHFKERDPERVERLWQRIQAYRALLAMHRIRDEAVRTRDVHRPLRRRLLHSWQAVVGLPIFAYGALVNALVYYVPRGMARRMARKETDYATIRLLASVVAVPVFWSLETWLVWRWAGAGWAAAFAISLPASGVIAYRYLAGAGRLGRQLRFAVLAVTYGQDMRRLVAERREIIDELERAKQDYLGATRGSSF
jgi:glycerol-3-phosphate O-acyltransferase/dihydroxyacetone phosphate acyltransferase